MIAGGRRLWTRALLGSVLVVSFAQPGCVRKRPTTEEPDASLEIPVEPNAQLDAGGDADAGLARAPESETLVRSSCGLDVAGPHWITEGDAFELQIACSSGVALRGEDVSFVDLPEGARFDPETSTLRWQPRLDQAAVYDFSVQLADPTESASIRVGVADAFDHPENVLIREPARYTVEYGLPVFFLTDPEHAEYTATTVVYGGKTYQIDVKTRGVYSLKFPKHSYTLKFDNDDLFRQSDGDTGLVGRKKITLTTTFDDNSFIRQRLAHEVWRRMDPRHIGVQSFSAIVYVDRKFHGIYSATDHVDRHLMRLFGLSDEGELFKAKNHRGTLGLRNHGMTKQEGVPREGEPGWDASLLELIDFVVESTDEELENELLHYVNVQEYQDWFVFVTLLRATDTAGKNMYHYLEDPEATFRCIPWDFNATFGQEYNTRRLAATDRGLYLDLNLLWTRMLSNPRTRAAIAERFRELQSTTVEETAILDLVDTYAAEVRLAEPRDTARWRAAYENYSGWRSRNDFTTFEEEVRYIRDWVTRRWTLFDQELEQILDENVLFPEDADAGVGSRAEGTARE